MCVCKIRKSHQGIPPTMRSGICVRGVRDEVGGKGVSDLQVYLDLNL